MTRARIGLTLGAFVLGLAAFSAVGYAQTGRLKGKVVDADNKPVEGAVIAMESKEMNRKLSTKTDKRGEYTQFLPPGSYVVTASKGNLTQTFEVRVSIDEKEQNFALKPGAGAGGAATDADRKKAEAEKAALTTAFSEGVALNNAGKFDEAIAKFNEVAVKVPKCVECHTNVGAVYLRKKDYDQAEVAYKKAIEVDPNSSEAYMGLANVYNAQKKFDQATEAGAQAQKLLAASGGGGGRRRWRRQRIGRVQPGRHRVERGEDSRRAEALRTGGRRRSEDGRGALLARHGQREPGQAPRGRQVLRGVPQARRVRPVRRTSQGDAVGDQEIARGSNPGPMSIASNLAEVRERIAESARRAGRQASEITLVAVSKTFAADRVREAWEAGQREFGENKVQEGLQKIADTTDIPATVASHRPPAIEQGKKGCRVVRLHPVGGLARPAAPPR